MYFNGERLKLARIYREYTITELAEKIQVSKQAISSYEKNQMNPKAEILFKLVSVLQFPRSFFTEKSRNNLASKGNTFFRARTVTKAMSKKSQRIKATMINDIYNFLNKYLNFPVLDLPKIEEDELNNIETLALKIRSYWNLGQEPIENVINLLERKGIVVSSLLTDTKNIDAFTQSFNINERKQYCVVLGSDKQSMVRRNFDAAHEFGHIIMHDRYVDVSTMPTEEFREMEKQANQFAASFLMPQNTFFRDLKTPTDLESYIELKKKWKVSMAAMIMRAKQLNAINNVEYQSLLKKMAYKKWRVQEPLDDILEVKRPGLFKQSVRILKENNILTGQQLVSELSAHNLSLSANEIEFLLDLNKGTLAESVDNSFVIDIRSKNPEHFSRTLQ